MDDRNENLFYCSYCNVNTMFCDAMEHHVKYMHPHAKTATTTTTAAATTTMVVQNSTKCECCAELPPDESRWNCPICSYSNHALAITKCFECGVLKTQSAEEAAAEAAETAEAQLQEAEEAAKAEELLRWNCSVCFYSNHSNATTNCRCGTPKVAEAEEELPRWNCKTCGYSNSGKNTSYCYECTVPNK